MNEKSDTQKKEGAPVAAATTGSFPEFKHGECGGNYCIWWGDGSHGTYLWGFDLTWRDVIAKFTDELNKRRSQILGKNV